MASTCDIYKHGIKLGSGSCAGTSASITSWSAVGSPHTVGRNVQIVVTQAGVYAGQSWRTRILTDNGSGTLTLKDACPFTDA